MSTNQGNAFAEFRELYDDGLPVMFVDAVRVINSQAETINESLSTQMRTETDRRQLVIYLLEQCILVCSEMLPSNGSAAASRRFRRIRRSIERVRRLVRARPNHH